MDSHERVRQAALLLLKQSADPKVDAGLSHALDSSRLGAAERERVAAVLLERGTEIGRKAVKKHAERKIALTSAQRHSREAAKNVLRKVGG